MTDCENMAERLGEDDMATQREEQFRAVALRSAAAALEADQVAAQRYAGRCRYCGQPCLPTAQWCDADCQDGWAHEQDVRRRQGLLR